MYWTLEQLQWTISSFIVVKLASRVKSLYIPSSCQVSLSLKILFLITQNIQPQIQRDLSQKFRFIDLIMFYLSK